MNYTLVRSFFSKVVSQATSNFQFSAAWNCQPALSASLFTFVFYFFEYSTDVHVRHRIICHVICHFLLSSFQATEIFTRVANGIARRLLELESNAMVLRSVVKGAERKHACKSSDEATCQTLSKSALAHCARLSRIVRGVF